MYNTIKEPPRIRFDEAQENAVAAAAWGGLPGRAPGWYDPGHRGLPRCEGGLTGNLARVLMGVVATKVLADSKGRCPAAALTAGC